MYILLVLGFVVVFCLVDDDYILLNFMIYGFYGGRYLIYEVDGGYFRGDL